MDCPFENNWLCSRLPEKTRQTLCANCCKRKYAQGQYLTESYFSNLFMTVLDGLLVKMEIEPQTHKMTASGLGINGSIYSLGDLFEMPERFVTAERTNICMTECTLAVWNLETVHHLFETDVDFVRLIFENVYIFCLKEKTTMMREIGSGDVHSAVRYMIKFCRDHGIPQLTHEQLALLCSRSRPSVTNALHQLIRSEPEIFR